MVRPSSRSTAVADPGEGVKLLRVADLSPRDLADWQKLADDALEANPFFMPAFVLPLAKARPKDDAHLLVVHVGERWTACLPVMHTWQWRRVPLPVLATWLSQYTFLGTPLVAAGAGNPLKALITSPPGLRHGLLVLEWIGAEGPVFQLLKQALEETLSPFLTWERFERAAMRRRAGYEVQISTKGRAEYRRRRRGLEKACGGTLSLMDLTRSEEAVEDFLRLEAAGWKGKEGSAIASHSHDADFFRAACRSLAASGNLQLWALRGQSLAAMQCNFITKGVVFGFRTCFDEGMARFSPGALMLLDSLESFQGMDAEWFDSCTDPDNELCNRLMPDRQRIETIVVGAGDMRGAALMSAMASAALVKGTRHRFKKAFMNLERYKSALRESRNPPDTDGGGQ